MFPFSEADLERVYVRAVGRDQRLADILLVDAWTGLRWSELRAIRVRDFVQVPMPVLVVQRAEPEGVRVKSTKSGRSRRVPVADRVLPIVRALAVDRDADAPLFVTASGHRLHATAFKRTLAWSTVAEGRRIHDLRHTAACLWLSLGVDVVTVQAWMGHVSIATTNLYLHHLGTSADKAGLDRLNRRGHAGGTQREAELGMTLVECATLMSITPSRRRLSGGGAKGIRTPDLLVANETRYRLRHSPADRPGADQHADFTTGSRVTPGLADPAAAHPLSCPYSFFAAATGAAECEQRQRSESPTGASSYAVAASAGVVAVGLRPVLARALRRIGGDRDLRPGGGCDPGPGQVDGPHRTRGQRLGHIGRHGDRHRVPQRARAPLPARTSWTSAMPLGPSRDPRPADPPGSGRSSTRCCRAGSAGSAHPGCAGSPRH